MLTRLEKINAVYHSFKEDQLLTHVQLNEFLNYFEDQNRLTRICLTGLGILNGFKVSVGANSLISITQGIGITSDGDLLCLHKAIDATTDQDKIYDINVSSKNYSHYKSYDNHLADYSKFFNDPQGSHPQFQLFELVEQGSDVTDASPLSGLSNLSDMVVLLYLEQYECSAGACAGTSCDNYGVEQHQALKILLISQSDLEKVISRDALYERYFLYDDYLELKDLAAKRVVLTTSNTSSFQALKTEYRLAIQDGLANLRDSLEKIYIHAGRQTEATQVKNRINQLLNFSSNQIPDDVQYRYDLYKDLISTYNELKDLFLGLLAIPFPETGSFPKHLMLGKVIPNSSEPFLRYRHQFYPTQAEGRDQGLAEFQLLLNRVFQMSNNYFIDPAQGIKATPSVFAAKLADRAIPFYYKTDQVLATWSYFKSKRLKEKYNLSYNRQNLSNAAFIQNPLAYNLDNYDFLRIEGYVNGTIETARTYLMQQITSFGLDFEFKIIDLNQGTESIQKLIAKHPSMEHVAGVKKGGTLLLVTYQNKLVADFSIDYKIPNVVETKQEECCYLMACTYPWISSLHYINNLSRSLYGTQSSHKDMPRYYKLQVMEYSINGISLIKSPVTLNIPLQSAVYLRRLHAVMDSLNKRFPTGLVFEFVEEIKKFKITKLERDTFKLVVRDVSLTTSPPTYTYTENGMLRNGKIFGLNDHVCQLIPQHRENFYRSLHEQLDPINKDDDYGGFKSDWSKWNRLKDQLRTHSHFNPEKGVRIERFPRTMEELTQQHIDELNGLKTEISLLYRDKSQLAGVKIYLYGDWPDGDWVDSDMLDYAAGIEKSDPNDDIVKFIKLRKELHNKNGVSKYILHLEGTGNKYAELEAIVAKYSGMVEFYYQRPSVGNYIVIKA